MRFVPSAFIREFRGQMIYPKRLIEVDLPIKRIQAHPRREKSIRHGHISTRHIWWARRPLACSAVICTALRSHPEDAKTAIDVRFIEVKAALARATLH